MTEGTPNNQISIKCERFNATIDVPTCLARQQSSSLKEGCKDCEEGTRVMREYSRPGEQEFETSTYPSGAVKITGICQICKKKKVLQSRKKPICYGCRERGNRGIVKQDKGLDGVTSFTIDLSACPEIIGGIKERADAEFRTIEGQIAWELKQLFG